MYKYIIIYNLYIYVYPRTLNKIYNIVYNII